MASKFTEPFRTMERVEYGEGTQLQTKYLTNVFKLSAADVV